ncbi:MAG: AraC family transcriptional regulator [bacterium]
MHPPPQCIFAISINVPAGFVCPMHEHTCTEIVFTGTSAGRLVQGADRYAYSPNSVFVYQPTGQHFIENEQAGTHLCIGVTGGDAAHVSPGPRPLTDNLADIAALVRRAIAQRSARQAARLNLLAGLLAAELCDDAPSASIDDDYAERARQVLDTRFAEPITIDELAESLFISADYLRRLFRRRFGRSPLDHLIYRRVTVAQEMLRMTDVPVREVARRCGIDSPYYFSRVFRKVTGRSPSAYRQEARRNA